MGDERGREMKEGGKGKEGAAELRRRDGRRGRENGQEREGGLFCEATRRHSERRGRGREGQEMSGNKSKRRAA